MIKIKYDVDDVVIVNQGDYKNVLGLVKSHKNDIVSIDDGNGGIIKLPESYLDGITKAQFIRMLVYMYNKVFNSDAIDE